MPTFHLSPIAGNFIIPQQYEIGHLGLRLSAFRLDILIRLLGAETFWRDPRYNLESTTGGFSPMVEAFRHLSLPWVALEGGGYNAPNVPRAW